MAHRRGFHTLLVTYRDRLARIGLELVARVLEDSRVELIVMFEPAHQSPEEELVTDMMTLIASFSRRVYGLRG